jgi:hypothetical protein
MVAKRSHEPKDDKPVTKAERDAFFADLKANPDKYRKEWDDEARKEHPDMTEEQLQASWDQLADQFGL